MANTFFDSLFSQRPSSVSARFPNEDAENNRLERERTMFMANPNRVEQIVSALSKQHVPFKKQEKLGAGSNLAKVDAAIPSDDPRKGMGSKVLEESNIAIFQNPDKHPLEVIKGVYDKNVEETKAATYEYLDAAQKPKFGFIPFTGKTVGKDVATAPGYEEYRNKKDEYNKTHFSFDEMSSPQGAATTGLGFALAGEALAKIGTKSKVAAVAARYMPRLIQGVKSPVAKIALTAAAAIPEFWAFEVGQQLVSKSDQLKDQPELVKKGAGFAAGALSMGVVTKGIAKYSEGVAARALARNKAATAPTSENLMEAVGENKKVGSALAVIDGGFKIDKPGVWRGDKGVWATAQNEAAKPSTTEDLVNRIISATTKGESLEQAATRIGTQDKLLSTLDNVKGKKFFDNLISDKTDLPLIATRNRLFREAVAAGNAPAEAAIITQKGMAKSEFDDIITMGAGNFSHSPEVKAKLFELGYTNPENISVRMGKTLVNRQKAGLVEARIKSEKEISAVLHDEANFGGMTEARISNPLASTDRTEIDRLNQIRKNYGLAGSEVERSVLKVESKVDEEIASVKGGDYNGTKTYAEAVIPVKGGVKTSPEIAKAQEEVAKANKLLGKETSKVVTSGKPIFKKGEPLKVASEEEWTTFFRKQKNLSDTPLNWNRTPEPIRKAYAAVAAEKTESIYTTKMAVENKDAEEAIKTITKTVHEPVEAMKLSGSEFVSDEQFAKAMGDFKPAEPMPAAFAAGTEDRLKLIRKIGRKKGLLKQEEIAEEVAPVEEITKKGGRSKVDFEDSAKDLYSQFRNKKISQDEYDSALDNMLDNHPDAKDWSKLGVAALVGGGLVAMSSLAPTQAEAAGLPKGVVTNATTEILGAAKKGYKEMVEAIVKGKYFTPEYVKGSFAFGEKGHAISVKPSIMNATEKYKKAKLAFQDLLSGNVAAEFIYNAVSKDGTKLPTNPFVELASRTSIGQANAMKAMMLMEDVMSTVPGGMSHQKEIAEMFKPLVEMETVGYEASLHKANIKNLDEMMTKLLGKKEKLSGADAEIFDADIYNMMNKQDVSKAELTKLNFNQEEYEKTWEVLSRDAAQKYPSSRIALALEGEGMNAADPWVLQYMNDEEKIAVGHIRRLNNDLAGFIIDAGGEPILSKAYMHHASHPDMDFQALKKKLSPYTLDPESVLPLAKLFHREFGSKQMMPDTQYVMQQYLPDIFKRVEIMDFWKKGRPDGWYAHKQAVTQLGWKGPMALMDNISKGLMPEESGLMGDVARKAYAFEAARLIALNPAPGFKHLMKQVVDWANFGFKQTAENFPRAFNIAQKDAVANAYESLTGKKVTRDVETNLYKTFTGAGNITAMIQDLGLREPKGWFENISRNVSTYGGLPINGAERIDRAVGFVGAMQMAAKKGMTAEDAIYGVYDTILKTSFYSGNQNPAWLRNPKIRAMMMFQGTPFKIAEQRVLLAIRGGRGVKAAAEEFWNQLQGMRSMVGEGEKEFKIGLIKEALEKEKDVFGIPYAHQMMRQMLALGTVIYGGSKLFGADLTSHVFHLPGVTLEEGKPTLSVNPIIKAALGAGKAQKDDEFWMSAFFKKWFNQGPMPAAVAKGMRLSNEDIPEMYKESKFRYFFGIPAIKEEK